MAETYRIDLHYDEFDQVIQWNVVWRSRGEVTGIYVHPCPPTPEEVALEAAHAKAWRRPVQPELLPGT